MTTAATTAERMLAAIGLTGRRQAGRVARLAEVLRAHPDARLVRCADERSGQRYGQARSRAGRCAKIGVTRWTPSNPPGDSYQLWAVWGDAGAQS